MKKEREVEEQRSGVKKENNRERERKEMNRPLMVKAPHAPFPLLHE